MEPTNMSKHAATRQQQRGIPPMMVDLLLNFGASQPSGDGTSTLYFDKKAKKRLGSYAGSLAQLLQKHLDAYLVVSGDKVITLGHRYDRIPRH